MKFTKLAICTLALCLSAIAQTDQQKFDAAFNAAQSPAAQKVLAMPVSSSAELSAREAAAVALAKTGYLVEGKIFGWGFDPYLTMQAYAQAGYTWVPNILQPVPLPPGLSFPGVAPYDPNNPPAGSIKVDLNPADYVPFAQPTVAPPPPAPSYYIGPLIPGTSEYYTNDSQPDGFTITTSAGTFTKTRQVVPGPFGNWIVQYYTKIS